METQGVIFHRGWGVWVVRVPGAGAWGRSPVLRVLMRPCMELCGMLCLGCTFYSLWNSSIPYFSKEVLFKWLDPMRATWSVYPLDCICLPHRLCLPLGFLLLRRFVAPVFTSFRQRLTSQEVGSATEPRCSSRVWGQASVMEVGVNLFPLLPRKEGSVVIIAFLKFRKHSTQGTRFLLVCSENCGFLSAEIKPKKSAHHQGCPG